MQGPLIFVILLLVCTFSAFSQNTKDDKVIQIVKKMIAAQSNFDTPALDKVFASDYIEISPVGEVDDRQKVIGFYKVDDPAQSIKTAPKAELDEFNVRNYGRFSIVIARLTFRPKDETHKIPAISMRTVFICRKEGNGWKISSAQFTGIRPPRTQPAKPQ